MTSASAASLLAVDAEIGWSRPSMVACPMPSMRVSRFMRTMTVVFASGVDVCAQPSECRASAASASAWSCGIVRSSSITGPAHTDPPPVPGTPSVPGTRSRRRSTSLTRASIAALIGAPVSGSRRARRCSMPPDSNIVRDRSPLSASSRGSTPSESSRASASRTPRMTRSSGATTARSTNAFSVTSARAGSARAPTRSSIEVTAAAASALIVPAPSAAATCGCAAGRYSPVNDCRSAVAAPTAMSRDASLRDPPVVAARSRAALWNPCFLARPVSPNSGPERRAISLPTLTSSASASRRARAMRSATPTRPASLICSSSTWAPPGRAPKAGIASAHAARSASRSRSSGCSGCGGCSMTPSCTRATDIEVSSGNIR